MNVLPIAETYLAAAAVGLLFTGGLITWPLAHRAGMRAQLRDQLEIARIEGAITGETPVIDEPIRTRGRHRNTLRRRIRAWWESTAPRDIDAPVRAALQAQAKAAMPGQARWRPSTVDTVAPIVRHSPLLRLAPGWRDAVEPIPVALLGGPPTDLLATAGAR